MNLYKVTSLVAVWNQYASFKEKVDGKQLNDLYVLANDETNAIEKAFEFLKKEGATNLKRRDFSGAYCIASEIDVDAGSYLLIK